MRILFYQYVEQLDNHSYQALLVSSVGGTIHKAYIGVTFSSVSAKIAPRVY